jgi:hypothetical protein
MLNFGVNFQLVLCVLNGVFSFFFSCCCLVCSVLSHFEHCSQFSFIIIRENGVQLYAGFCYGGYSNVICCFIFSFLSLIDKDWFINCLHDLMAEDCESMSAHFAIICRLLRLLAVVIRSPVIFHSLCACRK